MNASRHFVAFICLICFFVVVTLSRAQKVPGVYVFGDSSFDVGNNNYLEHSRYKANHIPYGIDYPGNISTGRFTNGKNSADFIAEKLGLVTAPPFLSLKSGSYPTTGVNFASGGATILNGTKAQSEQYITLNRQVEYYMSVYQAMLEELGSAHAQVLISKSLFLISIGPNDLGYYISSRMKIKIDSYVESIVLSLKEALKELYKNGARKYVVFGVPALGCAPFARKESKDYECKEKPNEYAAIFNGRLKCMLQGLETELKELVYSYIDSNNILDRFLQNPATYGFKEVKAACCGGGILNAEQPCFSRYCQKRSDYLFWDAFHATEVADSKFVEAVFNGSYSYTSRTIEDLIAT